MPRKDKKKIFKVFWAWQDEAEGEWLNELAQEGWGLTNYFCCFYTFEQIEPTDYVYKLDFKTTRDVDKKDYLSLFEDAGWEHVAHFARWHYFRKDASHAETLPEIYSDLDSKVQKYKNIAHILLVINLAIISIFFSVVLPSSDPVMHVFRWVYIFLIGIDLFAFVRLRIKINQLTRDQL